MADVAMKQGAGRVYKGCVEKKGYGSKRSAMGVRRVMQDETLAAYKCRICGRWHLGHDNRAMRG